MVRASYETAGYIALDDCHTNFVRVRRFSALFSCERERI